MSPPTIAGTNLPRPGRALRAWDRAFDLARLALMAAASLGVVGLLAAEAEFRRDTPDAVRTAASAGNTRYSERLAELVMEPPIGPQPEAASEAWRDAVRSDPRSASAWISLGFVEEQIEEARLHDAHFNKDVRAVEFARARAAFETAFGVDRQYAPAWALANFCFRRGDEACFWRAASRAAAEAPALAEAAASPGSASSTDLGPLLDLASRMDPRPAAVLDRLEAEANADFAAAMERAYLDYLIGHDQWEDAMTIARRLAARNRTHRDASDILRFDAFVTRLIAAGRASLAVGLWNDYAGFAPLDPDHGLSLTNGDFRSAPRNAGFDWLLASGDAAQARAATDGIERLWSPSQLEFRLTGGEPEQAPLAEQWLPLRARTYRLRFEYQTRDLPSPTGVHWERATQAASSLEPCASRWCEAHWSFWAGAGESRAPLRLVYRRELATARARGSLLVRHVRLEVL